MNWLMYIGGGLIFFKIVVGMTSYIENDFKPELAFEAPFWSNVICTLAVWVWICCKFIK